MSKEVTMTIVAILLLVLAVIPSSVKDTARINKCGDRWVAQFNVKDDKLADWLALPAFNALDSRNGKVFIIQSLPPIIPCQMFKDESQYLKSRRNSIVVREFNKDSILYAKAWWGGVIIEAGWINDKLFVRERNYDGTTSFKQIYP